MTLDNETRAVLKSGLRIANFSSAHAFTFDDGTVLAACSSDRARALMLEAREVELFHLKDAKLIDLVFRMSTIVQSEVNRLFELVKNEELDLVIVPLPVRQAILEHDRSFIGKERFVTVRIADRVTKTCCSKIFCL